MLVYFIRPFIDKFIQLTHSFLSAHLLNFFFRIMPKKVALAKSVCKLIPECLLIIFLMKIINIGFFFEIASRIKSALNAIFIIHIPVKPKFFGVGENKMLNIFIILFLRIFSTACAVSIGHPIPQIYQFEQG